MKKYNKVLILVLVIGIFSSGVVAANSINGLFEGFPIINIFVNGKKVEGDVPAISLKGRTMVPVRFVSEALGASVEWDNKTSSALITTKSTESTSGYSKEDIEKLQFYSKIANHYKQLQETGDVLAETSNSFHSLFNEMVSVGSADGLSMILNHFNSRIDAYNEIIQPTMNAILESTKRGIDVSDMNDILNDYSRAIDYYKSAFSSLESFNISKSINDAEDYITASNLGLELANKGRLSSAAGYYSFFGKVQTFK